MSVGPVAHQDPVAAAAELAQWLGTQASRIESSRRIPVDVAERLKASGVFRHAIPARYGGLESSPALDWLVTDLVARGCSSCAWLLGLGCANLMLIGRFPAAAQADVFDPACSPIVPMLTGGVGQDLRSTRVAGGIELSGKWRYASGIDVADWVGLLVPVPRPDGSGEDPHVAIVEQRHFIIDDQSWRVLGMCGTGSKDVALTRAFVPDHRLVGWSLLQAGGRDPACPNDSVLYRFPMNTAFAMSVLAPTLGVAGAVVDEFNAIARQRVSSGTREAVINDRLTQVELAQARAVVDLARRSLIDESERIVATVALELPISEEDRAAARMRLAMASRQALGACQRLFELLGGSLLPAGTRIERLFRDLHAMSSHFLLQPQPIGHAYGSLLLGLPLPAGARL